jgi:7,8-dihydropterin-6-yl-methyl-4-(beta-D-ribofuranosyl)aminobenzene 5'-phosphate synthase
MDECALRISVLCEDSLSRRGLVGEHGLSMLVELPDARVLLDTGPSAATVRNARGMGVELAPLDAIVVSHGHYDHTGGLEAMLAELGGARVIAHPLAFGPRYALRGSGAPRYIGPPHTAEEYEGLGADLVLSAEPMQLGEGLWTTGEVPRGDGGGLGSEKLRVEHEGELVPDDFRDDVSLVARIGDGLVVLTGCGHVGVCSIVAHAQRLMDVEPVHALIGGTHLVAADEPGVRRTADRLHQMGVATIAPCHCTGRRALALLRKAFRGDVMEAATGDILESTQDAPRPHVSTRGVLRATPPRSHSRPTPATGRRR